MILSSFPYFLLSGKSNQEIFTLPSCRHSQELELIMGTGTAVDDPLGMLSHINEQSAVAVEEVSCSNDWLAWAGGRSQVEACIDASHASQSTSLGELLELLSALPCKHRRALCFGRIDGISESDLLAPILQIDWATCLLGGKAYSFNKGCLDWPRHLQICLSTVRPFILEVSCM
jgi:hypothetical protein